MLYEYKEVGDEIELNVIEDDDEYNEAVEVFNNLFEEEEAE